MARPVALTGDALAGGVFTVETHDSWPRFLERTEDESAGAPSVPPLPKPRDLASAGLVGPLGERRALVASGGLALALALGAGAGLMLREQARQAPDAAVQIGQQPPPVPDQVSHEGPEALALADALEQRLAFARNLPEWLAAQTPAFATAGFLASQKKDGASPHTGDPDTSAALQENGANTPAGGSAFDGGAPLALIILRNLPAGVSFISGAPAGPGSWAIPAGDPGQLVMTLAEGSQTPVTAEVEMISRAGLSVGTLRLQLRKSQAVANTQPPPGTNPALASAPVGTPETLAAVQEGERAAEDPGGKPPRAGAHKSRSKSARGGGHGKRRHTEVAQVPRESKPVQPEEPKPAPVKTAPATDSAQGEQPQGPIAKLFSWIKGGNSKSSPAGDNSTTHHGLGMAPQ